MDFRAGQLSCSSKGTSFHRGLTNLIRGAVAKSSPVEQLEPRQSPPWYACPNCGGDLEEYDDRMRSLECTNCNLKLPATIHDEMKGIRELHNKSLDYKTIMTK